MNTNAPGSAVIKVGQIFTDRKTGERVRISNVTAEFIEWRDEATNSYGRMLRRFFPDFYQFNQA